MGLFNNITDQKNVDWLKTPFSTAIMLFTKENQWLAGRASVHCFLQQSWPNKELIIFNTTQRRVTKSNKNNITEIQLKCLQESEMFSLCKQNARGEWLLRWLPDCWYSSNYIELHIKNCDKRSLSVLAQEAVFSLKKRCFFYKKADPALYWSCNRHYNLDFNKPLLEQFFYVNVLDNKPQTVIRIVNDVIQKTY